MARKSGLEPFGYCLNTSTIRGQKLGLAEEIEIAARAGYSAIEPWIGEIDQFVAQGKTLAELKHRLDDAGLSVPSAIGFFEWIVDDDAARAKAIDEARRNFVLLQAIGGTHIAAPPMGAQQTSGINLLAAAERYGKLVRLGRELGVVPQVEVWGFSKTLGRLGEAALVAVESGEPEACVLADVYHLYKGGSSVAGLGLLNGAAMHVFHVNDYPAIPTRETIGDEHRVWPGDGVAPLDFIFRTLRDTGFSGFLSVELFSESYWKLDPLQAAKTGLEKTRQAVQRALGKGVVGH